VGCVNFVTPLPLADIWGMSDDVVAMARPSKRRLAAGPALRAALSKLLKEAELAIGKFSENPPAQAHLIRTRMKRLQGLSRLVPRARAWRENFLPALRDLKDLFAATRDATIVQTLAEKYAPGQSINLSSVPAPDLRRAGYLVETARGALDSYRDWRTIGWEDIADRAVVTYRAARSAWKKAARTNAPDAAFHDCRRRIKRLLYQCEYLGGRTGLSRMIRRADQAGEVFGEIQDVCMAEEWLQKERINLPADMPRSKTRLRGEALLRAEKLLGQKPRDFRRKLV
jgi:CHAD domain-containing protein